MKFDRILGRNVVLTGAPGNLALSQLTPLLFPDGRLCLVLSVPRHGQRLYELVEWEGVDEALRVKVRQGEEAIYQDERDPLVNWDEQDVVAWFAAAHLRLTHQQLTTQTEQRRLTPAHLERWFGEGLLADARPRYSQRLRSAGLTPAELEQVATLYRRQLSDQTVTWHTTHLFICGEPMPS